MLHDVGVMVDYNDHHKHGYYLILNAGLPGFDHRELALIALLARSHRKALPATRCSTACSPTATTSASTASPAACASPSSSSAAAPAASGTCASASTARRSASR